MEKIVIQFNGGITINADVSVKNVMYVKKIVFGILLLEDGRYLASIMDDSVIACDEVIDVEDRNFNEKDIACKTQNFTCLFINYHCIIDSCKYLLLSDKIFSKTKAFITIPQNQFKTILY